MSGRFYDDELRQLDPGLVRAVLSVLRFHVGKDKAIEKTDLVGDLRKMGFGGDNSYITFERKVRESIHELRNDGHLICSSSGDGGYYLAADWQEFEEFAQIELRSKIIDMSETLKAMESGAAKRLGKRPLPKGQESLF